MTKENQIPVTMALMGVLASLPESSGMENKIRAIFSDSRKPKGFIKAVGVKLSGISHSQELQNVVVEKMEALGYIHIRTNQVNIPTSPTRGDWWKGIRYTFAQPKYKL
jgi:hypothetical protein